VVWYHHSRTREELERLSVNVVGLGMVYAKHLWRGDPGLVRFVLRDRYSGCRGMAGAVVHGRPRWSDWRHGILSGFPIGLIRGLRTMRPGQTTSG
jgi:hypothetical protein